MKNIICVFFLLILFVGCDNVNNEETEKISFSPLDSKINFRVIESYDDYGTLPQIYVDMVTEKIYPCYNFNIEAKYRTSGEDVILDIVKINKPEICLTAFGPARARIKLTKSGSFKITFTGYDFTDTYNIIVSDSLIVLEGSETSHIKPLIKSAYRYPENSLVYMCGTLLSDSAIAGDFIDTLKSVINLTEFYFYDTTAQIPYPKSSSGHYYDAPARYFYYQNENDFNKISDVMKKYKKDHFVNKDGIGISVVNWTNQYIYSWML